MADSLSMESLHLTNNADDFTTLILSKFPQTSHIHVTLTSISQQLTSLHVSPSPISYLGAIIPSLETLTSDLTSSTPSIDALVVLLSAVIPRVSPGILSKRKGLLLELVVRVLRSGRVSENGVVAGLNCLGALLLIKDGCDWESLAEFYAFLLGYITNSDSKVRRQSHICIRDVLQNFQGSSFQSSASDGFANMLKNLLNFLGASKDAHTEKRAQEILHVLEALKDSLPYISMKYKTSILNNYKTLLGFRSPAVTRCITDSLNVLCLHPTADVNPDLLVDLLSLLAVSNPVDESSADSLAFTARLLDVGMRKVHNINRGICTAKLPLVFSSLQDVFGSGFEAAKLAATEAMKNLIQACIDDDLINEGVNRIKNTSGLNNKKSSPSVIEKLCANIGSLIDNRFRDEWDMSFQVVSLMFDKLGEYSCILMKGTLENLANIETESDDGFRERKQLRECIGSALGAMGPEVFLGVLPLKLQADTLSEINDWLFPILKQYTIGARLKFYVKSLLAAVDYLKQKSQKLKLEGRTPASRVVDSVIYHIWSLLPAFCNYPSDTAESFNLLKTVLRISLSEEPDLHGIICSSLKILIQQNKCVVEGKSYADNDRLTVSFERAINRYSKEVASANLAVLRSSAREFFSAISEVYLKSTKDPGGSLLATLVEFASIADKDIVALFFRRTMKKLLKVTEDGRTDNSKSSMQIDNSSSDDNSLSRARAQLFDLSASLLPGLGIDETDLLYKAMIPALKLKDGLVQKKAYKVLSIVFKNSDGFIARRPADLVSKMIEVLPSCHFSAKRHRLDCLHHLIVYIAKDEAESKKVEIISSFLTEIVLALKEANKKTRDKAYAVLEQIGHALEDEESGGNKGKLRQLFDMVAGCLAGESPHMISAGMRGLTRLTYEFPDLLSAAYEVLPFSFLLLQRQDREIIKANLGLLKVLIAKTQSENLLPYLKDMVEAMLKLPNNMKNHFKAKVKSRLEMLVKKCGLDAVKAVMPEEHFKLLTNIRKMNERKEKKLAANSETGSYRSKATTARQSEWGHTRIFSDFDDDTSDAGTSVGRRTMMSSKKSRASSLRKTTKSGKTLSEDLLNEDEPLDLLDQRKTRLSLRSGGSLKRKHDSDDDLEVDEDGKLIIPDDRIQKPEKSSDNDSDDDRTEVGSLASKNPKKVDKRRKTSESGWAYTGNEYASKKARGDVKKKGKLEPYAYWPLDRKMLSRRPEHRASARRGMASVVKMTKNLEGQSVASALAANGRKSKKAHNKKR